MDAALHGGDGHAARIADHHLAGVADGGRARESGDFGVGDAGRVGERIGECAEAGAEDEPDLRAERGALRINCAAASASVNWSVIGAEDSRANAFGSLRRRLSPVEAGTG